MPSGWGDAVSLSRRATLLNNGYASLAEDYLA
jgi:hypothetical protein